MRICTNCGRAYSRRDLYCPYCGRTPHRLGRVCPSGHHNPHDATFCAVCGSQRLSELAPSVPLWRRLILIFLIFGLIASLWFAFPILAPGALRLLSGMTRSLVHFLFLPAVCLCIPFAITLFLPKHVGKYIRKVLFTLIRCCFRLTWLAITCLWRIAAYFLSMIGGYGLQRGRR